jgi:hypothetical protein
MFRFDYSREFLTWHLTSPGCLKQWICGVQKEDKTTGLKSLVGFISAIPVHLSVSYYILIKYIKFKGLWY